MGRGPGPGLIPAVDRADRPEDEALGAGRAADPYRSDGGGRCDHRSGTGSAIAVDVAAMTTRRALWVSTSTATRGGVATYVRTMQQTPLWERWRIAHVVTHQNGSVARRVVVFLAGAGVFVRELLVRRPALVHLHTASYGSFARKAVLSWISFAARVPVVIHVHGAAFEVFYARSPRLAQRVIRATLERADAVVALGPTWARVLATIAPGARITVVSNAVEPRTPVVQAGPGEVVQALFLGEVEERKGTFLLLEAWGVLADELRGRARLLVAGGGAVDQARACVRDFGISDLVEVAGYVAPSEIEALLTHAHVLVLPSTFEGQPMAVLEAMAHGHCVLATDVGGIPDLVGDAGVLIPPSDLGSLVEALRSVVFDAERRAELGSRAFRRVQESFDVNATWKALDALYEEATQ